MKRFLLSFSLILLSLSLSASEYKWGKSEWISKSYDCKSSTNLWIGFRKHLDVKEVPSEMWVRIAADTKYWLWINGEIAVYEGGLKRGPAPGDGYYDSFDIAPFLKEGDNLVSVLLWHLGQNGFSHLNSGLAAIRIEGFAPGLELVSDGSWEAAVIRSYMTAPGPKTNYRLPEESVLYDARLYPSDWMKGGQPSKMGSAMVVAPTVADRMMGNLAERPVPLFRFSGLREYESVERHGDTLCCRLPYNGHFHPYLKIKADSGRRIVIRSDHDYVTKAKCVHAEYISRNGVQEYESLPWINGEAMYYIVPQDVEIISLAYRESSFATGITGHFICDDELINTYWQKAARTMMVCMRDTWYDCPDRERAQWWGDEVNELNAAFYSLSPSSSTLALKGIRELCAWQRENGSMYSPIPGTYFNELPMQILNSVGWYGFHNFYRYSGDSTFVADVYPAMRRYLHQTWQLDGDGLPIYRNGGWDWPDAGYNQDKFAQLAPWYVLALMGESEFARILGKSEDAAENARIVTRIKDSYNRIYWNGSEYRTPGHTGPADDRVQALAILSGLADADKYDALCRVFSEQAHATTYMLCYVLESLFKTGHPEMALERMHRFYPSLMKDDCSTLYEHFNHEGSSNHAWSSSGINILARLFAGIDTVEPGFKSFRLEPKMGGLKHIDCAFETKYGMIHAVLDQHRNRVDAVITVPEGSRCLVGSSEYGPGTHKVRIYEKH